MKAELVNVKAAKFVTWQHKVNLNQIYISAHTKVFLVVPAIVRRGFSRFKLTVSLPAHADRQVQEFEVKKVTFDLVLRMKQITRE